MAKDYLALNAHHREFIGWRHMFFTATAVSGTRINISPRSTDLIRVTEDNAICYLDRTGTGNDIAAHLRAAGRMKVMFCAVERPPHHVPLGPVGMTGCGPGSGE